MEQSEVCQLPVYTDESGQECKMDEARWSFQDGACAPVFYSGCGGSENLFEAESECLAACEKGVQSKHL